MSFSKYFYIFKTSLTSVFSYPIRFWSMIIADIVKILFFYFLWKLLYSQSVSVKGYTFAMMFTYYVITVIVGKFTTEKEYAMRLSTDIRKGDASNYLAKPYSYRHLLFFNYAGANILPSLVLSLIVILLYLFDIKLVSLPMHPIVFLVSLIMGISLNFYILMTVAVIAFYIVASYGVIGFTGRIISILSGVLVPLSLFPVWLVNILNYLPFKYSHYVPVEIYLGKISGKDLYYALIMQFIWLVIFIFISNITWNKAIKNYGAVGS